MVTKAFDFGDRVPKCNGIHRIHFGSSDRYYAEVVFDNNMQSINKITFLPEQQPLISKEHKFVYQPITKSACKTIKTWMLSLGVPDIVTKVGENNFGKDVELSHINDPDFNIHDYSIVNFGSIRYKKEEIIDNTKSLIHDLYIIKIIDNHNFEFTDTIKDYFKFTFIRNPWSRMLSAYLEKFRNPDGITYHNAKKFNNSYKNIIPEKYLKEFYDENGIISFKGFVNIHFDLSKKSYNNFDIHWMPQHIINDMYIKKYDFIGKLENFEDDFDKILETLNIKIKPKYKIGSNSHLYQKHYKFYENNPELIDKVAEIYKEDVERYGYDFSDLENS